MTLVVFEIYNDNPSFRSDYLAAFIMRVVLAKSIPLLRLESVRKPSPNHQVRPVANMLAII